MRRRSALGIAGLLVGVLVGDFMWGPPCSKIADELAAVRGNGVPGTCRSGSRMWSPRSSASMTTSNPSVSFARSTHCCRGAQAGHTTG